MDSNGEQHRPRGRRTVGPPPGGPVPPEGEPGYPGPVEDAGAPGQPDRPGRAERPVYPLQSLLPESDPYREQAPPARQAPYPEQPVPRGRPAHPQGNYPAGRGAPAEPRPGPPAGQYSQLPPPDGPPARPQRQQMPAEHRQMPPQGPEAGYGPERQAPPSYAAPLPQEYPAPGDGEQGAGWQQVPGRPPLPPEPGFSAPALPPQPRQFPSPGGARAGSSGPQGRYRGQGPDGGQHPGRAPYPRSQQEEPPLPGVPVAREAPGETGIPDITQEFPGAPRERPEGMSAGSQGRRTPPDPFPGHATVQHGQGPVPHGRGPALPRLESQPPGPGPAHPPVPVARPVTGAGGALPSPGSPGVLPPAGGVPEPGLGQDASFWFPSGPRTAQAPAEPVGGPGPSGPYASPEAPPAGPAGAREAAAPTVALSVPSAPVAGIPQPRVGVQDSASGQEAYERTTTEQRVGAGDLDLDALLRTIPGLGASDLHLTASSSPLVRVNGELVPVPDTEPLTAAMIQRVIYSIITQKQRERFEDNLELDFSYSVAGSARFRVNLYRQREALGAAFRRIPFEIKSLEDLGIPEAVSSFASLPRGLVLVTGPTGSGKSTTLASLIDLANRTRRDHIMTVEDPIEFLHRHKSCMVNQREIGEDTHSFSSALKHVLRQDPDIILVGEMRDLETISVALTAAETGHLVFATLHTQDASQTIDRVIDVFPPHQQQQVRVQLSGAVQGVVCQTLCRTADGNGRVVAAEVMMATPAIRNLIREGKTHQIYSAMQAGAKFGMQTLDQHLAELVRTRVITVEQGLDKCHHAEDFNRLIGRG